MNSVFRVRKFFEAQPSETMGRDSGGYSAPAERRTEIRAETDASDKKNKADALAQEAFVILKKSTSLSFNELVSTAAIIAENHDSWSRNRSTAENSLEQHCADHVSRVHHPC